jgi:hypothetical protein
MFVLEAKEASTVNLKKYHIPEFHLMTKPLHFSFREVKTVLKATELKILPTHILTIWLGMELKPSSGL